MIIVRPLTNSETNLYNLCHWMYLVEDNKTNYIFKNQNKFDYINYFTWSEILRKIPANVETCDVIRFD